MLNKQTYGIKVLNMSLGYQPVVSTVLNPLDIAVEAAWNTGIAVVTSAGNKGDESTPSTRNAYGVAGSSPMTCAGSTSNRTMARRWCP